MKSDGDESPDRFERMSRSFEAALQRVGCHSSSLTIAGVPARLRIAGGTLASAIEAPFAHTLAAAAIEPRLRIDLWDENATGVDGPRGDQRHATGKSWPMINQHLAVAPDGRFVSDEMRGCVTWFDRQTQRLVGSVPDARRLSLHQRGKPLQTLLGVWLGDRGCFGIHAALVARGGRGVLVPGSGGSGKSTTAISCLLGGLAYLGDDWVGVERRDDGSFLGHSLYSSAFLDPQHLRRFPDVEPHAQAAGEDDPKSLLLLSSQFPGATTAAATIEAIALPCVNHQSSSRLSPATKREALLRILPSTAMALRPRAGPEQVLQLAALVEHLPSFHLEIGADLSDIARKIDDILTSLR